MDAFLDELKTEGRTDSEGRFTVDWARANQLLAERLLSQPEDAVLKVIQAAVRAGATYLHVSYVPDGLVFDFDRPALTAADLASLPAALLSPGAPLRDLALALHSTCVFHIRTPEGSVRGNRQKWVWQDDDVGPQRVVLSTVKPLNLQNVARRCPHPPLELRLPVSQWCYAYPAAEVRHEGQRRHLWLPSSPARLLIKLPPEEDFPELSVGLDSDDGPTRLWLSVAGVCVLQELNWRTLGVVAYVSADHLNTDLSGLKIVEDEAYEDLLDDLRRETERLVKEVDRKLPWVPRVERLKVLRMGY